MELSPDNNYYVRLQDDKNYCLNLVSWSVNLFIFYPANAETNDEELLIDVSELY